MEQYELMSLIKKILIHIGEDPDREGLLDTPRRVADMYNEIFCGYKNEPPKITFFTRKKPGGLIIDRGYFYSNCEHHGIPFFGNYYFGYIPNEREIGASKIGRTIDHYSAKLQTAEKLSCEILDRIEEVINPLGCILLMTGRHLCKEARGVKKHNSPFEVIEARGVLLSNRAGCKDEFISRIGSKL